MNADFKLLFCRLKLELSGYLVRMTPLGLVIWGRAEKNWRPQALILRTINCGEGIPRPVEKGQGNQGRAGT